MNKVNVHGQQNILTSYIDRLPQTAADFPLSLLPVLKADYTVEQAFKAFKTHKSLYLIVQNGQDNSYLGWVSAIDFFKVFLELDSVLREGNYSEMEQTNILNISALGISKNSKLETCFELNICPIYNFVAIERNESIENIIQLLSENKTKCLSVLNPRTRKIEKNIFDKDIIEQLSKIIKVDDDQAMNNFNSGKLVKQKKTLLDNKIDQFNFCKNVFTVSETASLKETLRIMNKNKISSLPILDEEGFPIAQINAEDLLQVLDFGFDWFKPVLKNQANAKFVLDENVMDFFTRIRQSEVQNGGKISVPFLSVKKNVALKKAIKKLSVARSRRVFIKEGVDVVGIVSVKDYIFGVLKVKAQRFL
eukprot:maker-scaffold_1-snap-gene-1.29-mRNA-1 protein AED:0.07 eAED:0.07 QI:153/0.5/0.33/1/1/1/3/0/362